MNKQNTHTHTHAHTSNTFNFNEWLKMSKSDLKCNNIFVVLACNQNFVHVTNQNMNLIECAIERIFRKD